MALEGEAGKQRAVAVDGAAAEVLPAQLMLRSVGYRSVDMAGLPWNDSWGVVPTDARGRVQVRFYAENDGVYTQNDEFYTQNDEFRRARKEARCMRRAGCGEGRTV